MYFNLHLIKTSNFISFTSPSLPTSNHKPPMPKDCNSGSGEPKVLHLVLLKKNEIKWKMVKLLSLYFLGLGYNRNQEIRTLVPGKKFCTSHYMNIRTITGRTMKILAAYYQTCKWKDNMKLGEQKCYLPLTQPSKFGASTYFT